MGFVENFVSHNAYTCGACQADAFLKCYIEEGVNWVHVDITDSSMGPSESIGWESKILV